MASPAGPFPLPAPLEVTLERRDLMTYSWARALERPVLPFFLYTFSALIILSLFNLWPPARVYALVVLLPMLGYGIWLWSSARALWARYPELAGPRRFVFKKGSYLIEEGGNKTPVPYDTLERVLETRQALYLVRQDGSADLLPKRTVPDVEGLTRFLKVKVCDWRGSRFL